MKDLKKIIETAFEAGFREASQGPKSNTDSPEPLSTSRRTDESKRFEKRAR